MLVFAIVVWLAVGWIGCLLMNAHYWHHFQHGIDRHMWWMSLTGPINLMAVGIVMSWPADR